MIFNHTFGDFKNDSGIYINIFHQRKFYEQQSQDIMSDTLTNWDTEQIMNCHVNHSVLTLKNVLANFCPDAFVKERKVVHILDKMEIKSEPGFLIKALLRGQIAKLMTRAIKTNVGKEVNELKERFKGATLKNFLETCGKHNITIGCVDTTKDFCKAGIPIFGLFILLTILLPGLVQGLGNMVFYRVHINSNVTC